MNEIMDLSFFDREDEVDWLINEIANESTEYIDSLKSSLKKKLEHMLDWIVDKIDKFIGWLIKKKNSVTAWYSDLKANVSSKFGEDIVEDYKGLYQYATSAEIKNRLTLIETNLNSMIKNTEAYTKMGILNFKIDASLINTKSKSKSKNDKLNILMDYDKSKEFVNLQISQIKNEIDDRVSGKIHEPVRKISKKAVSKEITKTYEGYTSRANSMHEYIMRLQDCYKQSHKLAELFKKRQLSLMAECIGYTSKYIDTLKNLTNLSDTIFKIDSRMKDAKKQSDEEDAK